MDRRFHQTGEFLRPLGTNWKLPSVRDAAPVITEPLSTASLARLRGNRARPPTVALRNTSRVCAPCVVKTAIDERKLYIPTGERNIKKNGELGAEHKIPVILVTVTASIMHGKREAFFYRVTNRSTKVEDSRYVIGHKTIKVEISELAGEPVYETRRVAIYRRKPIAEVRSELQRICGNDAAADTLQAFIAD